MTDLTFNTSLNLRIDWSELDYFGHVNNVSFFKYIQAARVHYWDMVGITQSHRETNIGPMLASCKCDFKQPLFYPGIISIQVRVDYIKHSSFSFHHRILNEQGELSAEAHDVMVMFDFNQNKKVKIADYLRQKIESIEKRQFA